MSRRTTVRPIAPADLRDHADEARIGRIWDRLEHDLTGVVAAPAPARSRVAVWLVAAALGAFAGGVTVGKTVWEGEAPATIPTVATSDRPQMDVLAAGTEARTYSLPGGGELKLEAGATVEIERAGGGTLTLRLVQGAASVDTKSVTREVDIVAGQARLSAAAGSVVSVTRDAEDVDVRVSDGSVSITRPSGESSRLGSGDSDRVPMRVGQTAALPKAERRHRAAPPVVASTSEPGPVEPPAAVAAVSPTWYALYRGDQWVEARKALDLVGADAAIGQASSAAELIAIASLHKERGPTAIRAYERVLASFAGDAQLAPIAARNLGKIYEKTDPELAQKYFAIAGKSQGLIGEDSRCRQMRAAKSNDEAVALAKEYLQQHPNGSCADEAQRIAEGDEGAEEAPEPPSSPDKAPAAPKP